MKRHLTTQVREIVEELLERGLITPQEYWESRDKFIDLVVKHDPWDEDWTEIHDGVCCCGCGTFFDCLQHTFCYIPLLAKTAAEILQNGFAEGGDTEAGTDWKVFYNNCFAQSERQVSGEVEA